MAGNLATALNSKAQKMRSILFIYRQTTPGSAPVKRRDGGRPRASEYALEANISKYKALCSGFIAFDKEFPYSREPADDDLQSSPKFMFVLSTLRNFQIELICCALCSGGFNKQQPFFSSVL